MSQPRRHMLPCPYCAARPLGQGSYRPASTPPPATFTLATRQDRVVVSSLLPPSSAVAMGAKLQDAAAVRAYLTTECPSRLQPDPSRRHPDLHHRCLLNSWRPTFSLPHRTIIGPGWACPLSAYDSLRDQQGPQLWGSQCTKNGSSSETHMFTQVIR
ncbi:uncharacterized protein LOC123429978 [Hordeum vulgare subsp. vulgare]|uniref:uncharacterized protein LOC123429978 n=1 Tax=Hordeum vulgare subsp. vulgare TaxID=112509 RepID=UPI001D1A506F|nr:uncharacterized protein LOC123429978 [Hordeum vulgare subsp. vulgare]